MGELTDRNAIDTLAAGLFARDHPDRSWDPLEDHRKRLGVASAIEKAVYRGFATARLEAERRLMPEPAIAAAALAADPATPFMPRPAPNRRG